MRISRILLSLFLAVMVLPSYGVPNFNSGAQALSQEQLQQLRYLQQLQARSQSSQSQLQPRSRSQSQSLSLVGKNSLWSKFYRLRQSYGISADRVVSDAMFYGRLANYGLRVARQGNPEAFNFIGPDASVPVDVLKNAYDSYYGFWTRSVAGAADGLAAGREVREITQESARAISDKYSRELLLQVLNASGYGQPIVYCVNAIDDFLRLKGGLALGGRTYGGFFDFLAKKTIAPILYPILYKSMMFCTGQ